MSPRPFELEVLEDRTVPATFTVTNLADTGDGSLRDAVADANAAAGVDVVRFADNLTGTITLQFGEIQLTDDVAIEGPGADVITISGGNASRIFWARQFTNRRYDYAISGLTLANGADSDGGFGGGAILATSQQTLRLSDLIIENSFSAASGGAVEAVGSDLDLFVARSIFRNNASGTIGGAIYVSGRDAFFSDSTFDGNQADNSAGAIAINSARGLIERTTISRNQALDGGGGGVTNGLTTVLTVVNSTLAENAARGTFGSGGAIENSNELFVYNSTIARNTSEGPFKGGGIETTLFRTVLVSTLVAENINVENGVVIASDVEGTIESEGFNYFSTTFGMDQSVFQATDVLDRTSLLGLLQNNGGPTETILPGGAPFALGAGANPLGLPTDQRGDGFPRSAGGDIGAVDTGSAAVPGGGGRPGGGAGDGNGLAGSLSFDFQAVDAAGFIQALYEVILNRQAEEPSLTEYVYRIKGGESRESIAGEIWRSWEHRRLQVAGYYQDILGRPGTDAEIASWVDAFLDGATEEEVIAGFLASDEFARQAGAPDAFIDAVYQVVLGRDGSDVEIQPWVSQLHAGESRFDVALGIILHPEARARAAALHYNLFFGTFADPVGRAAISSRFAYGGGSITDLAIEIAAGADFYAVVQGD